MSNYEGRKIGEIRICYDPHRTNPWYARIPLENSSDEPAHKRLLSETNALEVDLKDGRKLLGSTKRIITELQSRGISTTTLRVKPYQS